MPAQVLRALIRGYEDATIALNCGTMVRTAIAKDRDVTAALLNFGCPASGGPPDGERPVLDQLFGYVQVRSNSELAL